MRTDTVMLLKAASALSGGDHALARRLGIGETLLAKFMGGVVELPDGLLLRAVDIVLDNRRDLTAGASISQAGD